MNRPRLRGPLMRGSSFSEASLPALAAGDARLEEFAAARRHLVLKGLIAASVTATEHARRAAEVAKS